MNERGRGGVLTRTVDLAWEPCTFVPISFLGGTAVAAAGAGAGESPQWMRTPWRLSSVWT